MRRIIDILVWLAEASRQKIQHEEEIDIDARLKRIEDKLDKSFPIALFIAGIPLSMVALSNLVNNAIQKIPFENGMIATYSIGGLLISFAVGLLTNKIKWAVISVIIVFGLLMGLQIFSSVSIAS